MCSQAKTACPEDIAYIRTEAPVADVFDKCQMWDNGQEANEEELELSEKIDKEQDLEFSEDLD